MLGMNTELRTVAAGVVHHVDGDLHVTKFDSMFGTPNLTETVMSSTSEIGGGLPTSYHLTGQEAAVDDLYAAFAKAGVLDNARPQGGNMMAVPYGDVKEGQSALIAETFGGDHGGPTEYRLVFDTDKPPASIKDAMKALDELVEHAHAQGPDPSGGAIGFGGLS
ncbi:MAG: hypothetical protein JWL76_1144 [Thermoleophilia bacterium]|nr:hypothetical protein [Thermoleophilia bacterium]